MKHFVHPQTKDNLKIGPNAVHAVIIHGPNSPDWEEGAVEDLGTTYNVTTTANNGGRDMVAALIAGQAGFGVSSTIAYVAEAG